jgi:uncharacterized protein YjbJ (UPF0337 family)
VQCDLLGGVHGRVRVRITRSNLYRGDRDDADHRARRLWNTEQAPASSRPARFAPLQGSHLIEERGDTMSNDSKRVEGAAEEIGGKIKGGIGNVIGSDRLRAEGKARELEGKAKQEAAKAAERAKGKAEQVKGAVKNRVGAFVDNERLEADGRAEELRGEDRQDRNRPDSRF